MKKAFPRIFTRILVFALACSFAVCPLGGCAESAYVKSGREYASDEQYEKAKEAFSQAIEADEEDVSAYIGLAEACENLLDTDGAEAALLEGYIKTGSERLRSRLEEAIERSKSALVYEISDGVAVVTDYGNVKGAALIIPDKLGGYPVTAIADNTFDDSGADIRAIWLPDGVKSIGANAFRNCVHLKTVRLPESLETIGDGAFAGHRLLSIDIPNKVKTIGESAFAQTGLTEVFLPAGVESLGPGVFYGCLELSGISVDEKNRYFSSEDGVLYNKDKTELIYYPAAREEESFAVPEGVKTIGAGAFGGPALKEIALPPSVEEITEDAFYGCSALENIALDAQNGSFIDDGGALYDKAAVKLYFYSNNKTDSVYKIKDGVEIIYPGAFNKSPYLHGVTIPETVEKIGKYAFSGCARLIRVQVLSESAEIGEGAFSGCSELLSVEFDGVITAVGAYAFRDCRTLLYFSIPDSVISIGEGAFSGCKALSEVKIPSGVSRIEASTFKDCERLSYVRLPAGLSYIGYGAFSGCKGLRSVVLPYGLSALEPSAFSDCSQLGSVRIPARVKRIGDSAFRGCTGLTEVIMKKVEAIEYGAFFGCVSLKAVDFPSSLREIYGDAFSGCTALKSVEIGKNVIKIGNSVFGDCTGLESITVSEENGAYRTLNGMLFSKDGKTLMAVPAGIGLSSISVPNGVSQISSGAFSSCAAVERVKLPEGVTVIAPNTFHGCAKLAEVDLPDGLIGIECGAFYRCSSLVKITLPAGVEKVYPNAFEDCASLSAVTLLSRDAVLEAPVFNNCPQVRLRAPAGSTAEKYAAENGLPFESTK